MSIRTKTQLGQLFELIDASNTQEMALYEGARMELSMHNISDKEYLKLISNMYLCLRELRGVNNSVDELSDLFEIFLFEL